MEQLLEDLKQAMRDKDALRLSVIRMVKGDVDKIRIDQKCEITDTIFYGVIEKQLKMREDALEQFTNAGREDLMEQTKKEIQILKAYLPEQLEEQDVINIIEEAFEKINPETIRDMGKVMGYVTPLIKGRFDMKKASSLIQQKLNTK